MTTTANLTDIPFNKLTLWKGNVRKTGIETGLDELAASIAAHGLLSLLLVRKGAKGKYAVVAGQRRYLAMQRLAMAGNMKATAPVSCHLRDDDRDDSELSLAENVVRVAMHPADQFDAWRDLIDKGASVPDIAARFGVSESTVRKRLALARVSPCIFALYRDGAIDLEALQAFTVTDDHAAQESVWQALPDWQRGNARAIRDALTETDIPSDDDRVRFVGLDAYEAAGGLVRRDLFDPQDGGFVQDVALLDALATQKLESIASSVRAEGWKWVELRTAFDWEDRRTFQRADMIDIPLPEPLQEEADRLQAEGEALSDIEGHSAEDEAASEARMHAIGARLDEIDAMARVYSDAVKACAGAVIYVAHGGTAAIERGLVRPEDAAGLRSNDPATTAVRHKASGAKATLSAALAEELTAQKTAALRIELARSPDIALALVVHAFATGAFYHAGDQVLKARLTTRSLRPSIKEHESCAALLALEAEHDRVREMLPAEQVDLWDWCLAAGREDLFDVLAVAAAHGIDAVESKGDANRGGREHGQALAEALKLDMARWYHPTAARVFQQDHQGGDPGRS